METAELDGFEVSADDSGLDVVHTECREIVYGRTRMPTVDPYDLREIVEAVLDHDCPNDR